MTTQKRYFATIQNGREVKKVVVYGYNDKEAREWALKTTKGQGKVTSLFCDGPAVEEDENEG